MDEAAAAGAHIEEVKPAKKSSKSSKSKEVKDDGGKSSKKKSKKSKKAVENEEEDVKTLEDLETQIQDNVSIKSNKSEFKTLAKNKNLSIVSVFNSFSQLN